MSDNVLVQIRQGLHDDELDDIIQYAMMRKKSLASMIFAELKSGDRVRFVSTVRPTYLRGAQGTVVGKKVSKLIIKLDRPMGRFHSDIRVPPSIIERVEEVSR